ncbi:hypothetical protein [Ornithinimicrobium kibberense]|uniref:hypothetical protein n=1 Tax=Ornithinimicrobium kibberense TaxID=282060 RepID=UPI00360E2F51
MCQREGQHLPQFLVLPDQQLAARDRGQWREQDRAVVAHAYGVAVVLTDSCLADRDAPPFVSHDLSSVFELNVHPSPPWRSSNSSRVRESGQRPAGALPHQAATALASLHS